MIEIGEFKALTTDEAASSLSVVLRKRGIHRDADVSVQVAPPATDEEIEGLMEAGHLEEDVRIERYEGATDLIIDKADRLGLEHKDAAIAIAARLARFRELESAQVSVMETYMGGDYSEYVDSTVLLVRK